MKISLLNLISLPKALKLQKNNDFISFTAWKAKTEQISKQNHVQKPVYRTERIQGSTCGATRQVVDHYEDGVEYSTSTVCNTYWEDAAGVAEDIKIENKATDSPEELSLSSQEYISLGNKLASRAKELATKAVEWANKAKQCQQASIECLEESKKFETIEKEARKKALNQKIQKLQEQLANLISERDGLE